MELIHDYVCPGAMISQIWPGSQDVKWNTLYAVEYALDNDFCKGIQTVDVPYREERIKIGNVIKDNDIRLTYCVARVMNKNNLNLSDLEHTNRKRSIEMMMRLTKEAEEMSAQSMSFISGPAPADINKRPEALNYLQESLSILCDKLPDHSNIKLVIEPLDVFAHKKNTLGYTNEAADICKALKSVGPSVQLCIDTAHAVLNMEDPVDAAILAHEFVSEFHFCNCISDPGDPIYGDNHIPVGKPGDLDERGIALIFRDLRQRGFLNGKYKPLFLIEAATREGECSENVFRSQTEMLARSWRTSYLV